MHPAKQSAFWRLVDRVEEVAYHNGWPGRIRRVLGLGSSLKIAEHFIEISSDITDVPAMTVGFAADFHAGVTTDPDLLQRACAALEAAQPDLLLLGGDFVSPNTKQLEWLARLLGGIPAPLGRFAVLGNHDRWNGADLIIRALEASGIELLNNTNRRLPAPFEHMWICGLDDFHAGAPDARRALSGAHGSRIVLMHSPANLLNLGTQRFDLALCGHTHGGQIALPGGIPLCAAPGPLSRTYNRGRYTLKHGGRLIVTVGLGCSTLPIRFNSDPEVILCRISTVPSGTPQ